MADENVVRTTIEIALETGDLKKDFQEVGQAANASLKQVQDSSNKADAALSKAAKAASERTKLTRVETEQAIALIRVEADELKKLNTAKAAQKKETATRSTLRTRADEQLRVRGGTTIDLEREKGLNTSTRVLGQKSVEQSRFTNASALLDKRESLIEVRGLEDRKLQAIRGGQRERQQERNRELEFIRANGRKELVLLRDNLKEQNRLRAEQRRIDKARLMSPAQFLQSANNYQSVLAQARQQGVSPSQALFGQVNAAASNFNANPLNTNVYSYPRGGGQGGGGAAPPNRWQRFAGALGFGGGGGALGGVARNVLGGLGVGAGMYAVTGATRAITEATETATAYERQMVAARNLAGTQQKLNDLLLAYAKASGGAVDQVTILSDVTRLQATGFADSAAEVEKFVRSTRGASIALGKPQDYVIQETQLAISNTSFKRLDQIGLGIGEVQERMKSLRSENKEMTREAAFQAAVMGLLDEKFGGLTNTIEGQATGVEKLKKTWKDLGLEVGQVAKGPVDVLAESLAKLLDISVGAYLQTEIAKIDAAIKLLQMMGIDNVGGLVLRTSAEKQRRIVNDERDAGRHPGRARVVDTGYDEDQQAVMVDHWAAVADLERNSARDRQQAIEQYETQRTQTIASFEKQIAREAYDFSVQRLREAQDFNLQRARAGQDFMLALGKSNEQFERQRVKAEEDLALNIADAQRDYDEREVERIEDHQERLEDLQKDYEKERERAAEDHEEAMRKAAGSLDAIAVAEEQRRYKRELKDAQEAHQEQIDDENEKQDEQTEDAKKALDRRIEDAREAHRRQQEDALENHRRQQEDQAEAYRLAKEREDEDRALRIQREDEDRALAQARQLQDHEDELAAQDAQHEKRLLQIEEQQQEERLALDEQFKENLSALKIRVAGFEDEMEKIADAAMRNTDHFLRRVEMQTRALANGETIESAYGTHGSSADPYAMREMPGSATTATSKMYGNWSPVFNIHPSEGMDEEKLAGFVEEQVYELLVELGHVN